MLDDFDFSYIPSETDQAYPGLCSAQCTHVWRALNPATGQVYGYGGVKLFARDAFMDKAYLEVNNAPMVDVTTEVAKRGYHYLPMEDVSNETRFATTPFNAWKSAFRETVKLASGVATQNRRKRINEWLKPNEDVPYSAEIALGAKMGENYGNVHVGNGGKLFKINNWAWLKSEYKSRNLWSPAPVKETALDFEDGRYMLSGIQKYVEWKNNPHVDMIEDCRRAVMWVDEDAIRRCSDWLIWDKKDNPNLKIFLQYIQSGKKQKFNPERCIHFMFDRFSTESDNFFGLMMGAVVEVRSTNYTDALSKYQVESKLWLLDELKKIGVFNDAVFIGGWLGISSLWLTQSKIAHNVTNIDLDENAILFSNKLNSYNEQYSGGVVTDVSDYELKRHDLVINTSAEHMDDKWFKKVKKGSVVAIQTNDFHEIEEHINTVKDLTELQKKYKMKEIYYIGEHNCDRYNRYMIIGKK